MVYADVFDEALIVVKQAAEDSFIEWKERVQSKAPDMSNVCTCAASALSQRATSSHFLNWISPPPTQYAVDVGQYVQLETVSMWGIHLVLFARDHIAKNITHVQVSAAAAAMAISAPASSPNLIRPLVALRCPPSDRHRGHRHCRRDGQQGRCSDQLCVSRRHKLCVCVQPPGG